MTAAAKSPSEPAIDVSSLERESTINSIIFPATTLLLPATRDPLHYDFMTKYYGFMTKLISGISGQSENGLLTRNRRI
jgi:hypothetical protein